MTTDFTATSNTERNRAFWTAVTDLRIVPLVTLDDPAGAPTLAEGLTEGGLPLIEVTLRTPRALESIAALAQDGRLIVGVGSVIRADQVRDAHRAGATFVVSPGFSDKVVAECQRLGLPILPGVSTATDIMRALAAGLTTVKFFPAETSGGAKAVSALSAPFPGLRFVPTGGIGPSNLGQYLAVPSVLAIGGSWIASAGLIRDGKVDAIALLARDALALTAMRGTPDTT